MRILPAFGVIEGCAATEVEAAAFASDCARCNFAETVKTVCMRPEVGKQDGPTLLVMGLYPGSFEDRSGRPNTGKSGEYLRKVISAYWNGRVVYDNAIRCAPKDRKPNDKHVKACRSYTHTTLVGAKPDHILCLGRWAQKTILGTSEQAEAIRNGWRWVRLDGRDVLMTFQPHPARILQNSLERRRFEQGVKRALSLANPPKPPTDASVYVIEDADDAREAVAYLSSHDAVAFDVETSGKVWSDPVATAADVDRAEDNCMMLELIQQLSPTRKHHLEKVMRSERLDITDARKLIRATQKVWAPDYAFINLDPPFRFEVYSCGLSALHDKSRRAYVWDPWAMRDPHLRQFLLDFLAGPILKHGANVKYDVQAFRYADGIEILVGGDVQLERKMLNANSSVKLAALAYLVGLGGLKDAAEEELKQIQKFLGFYDKARGVIRPGEAKQWSYGLLRLDTLTVYNGRDAITTAKAGELIRSGLKHNKPIYDHYKAVVRPAIAALATVEENGMPICRTSLEVLDMRMTTGIESALKIIDNYCPGLNPNSTQQLQQFLFTQLKLTPVRLTDGGAWSTDKDTLNALVNKHPVVSDLIRYRTLTKLHGTYVKGMFRHISKDGRVHPTYKIDGAATGRLASSDPNAQNIPRAETNEDGTATWGKLIKQCFRAADGWRILSLDYSQLEIRVAAWLSEDPEMLKAFLSGEDFHMRTAKMVSQIAWGIPPEQCTKVHRTAAKSINFGVLYGKTVKMLAKDLGCTEQEAQHIWNAIMGKFQLLDAWCKARLAFARKHGYTVTYWEGRKVARRRPLPDIRSADKARRETAERGAWNCVDFETEALTQRGWVAGPDLNLNDILLTKNAKTGVLEWEPMTDLKVWPNYEGDLVEFSSRSFSAVSTPNHRWLVRDKHSGNDRCVVTERISNHGDHRIHRTGNYLGSPDLLDDDFVELCGWYLTDGSRGKSSAYVCQSERANPNNAARIEALLVRLGAFQRKHIDQRCQVASWYVTLAMRNRLDKWCPERRLTGTLMCALTRRQLDLLLEVMMFGDGCESGGSRTFYARDEESVSAFQYLCVLCGIATTSRERDMSKYTPQSPKMHNVPKGTTHWNATLLRRDTVQVLKRQKRQFHAKQGVWCPIVPNTYFVARRHGAVYITGNTSIQGTAADFNTAATALILAWLKKEKLRAKLIGSVHDATIFECPEEELAIVTRGARKIMTAWDTGEVPLIIDAEMGQTWGDLEAYDCAA